MCSSDLKRIGQYTTTLTVRASDGQSASLPVTLSVLASGLTFGSGGVTFTAVNGAPIPSQAVVIDTDNKVAAAWSASSGAGWLSAAPASGTTPASTVLTVDPGVGKLASGSHATSVTLRAAGLADAVLPVRLELVRPTLQASANSLTLGGTYGRDFTSTASLVLGLNTLTNSWPWQMSARPAWATASAAVGTVGQAGATTVFTAVPAGAPVGFSTQRISIAAQVNGDAVATDIALNINKDRHKLIPAQTGVALSGTPGWTRLTRTVAVSDNFGTFGGMSATSNQPWLVAGVSGANLLLTADPSQLATDSLSIATVTITPLQADVTAPETIRVALWKGTLSPLANVTLPAAYTRVVTDPIRPYAYVHNGSAAIDVYNLYSGERVATIGGFSTTLGDMATSANGDTLLLHDIGHNRITRVDLATRAISGNTELDAATGANLRLKVIRPNGVELLVLSDGTVYATDTWRRLPSLPLTAGALGASGDGKRVLQQSEGDAVVQQTTVTVDYAELASGTLFAAQLPKASHAGVGTLGRDIAVSADGAAIYSASSTPERCMVLNPLDLGVLAYLAAGGGAPNNVEVDADGRVICGAARRAGSGSDVWIYSASGVLAAQKTLAAAGRALQPRQLAVSGDGRLLIGITDDSAATIVPVGP